MANNNNKRTACEDDDDYVYTKRFQFGPPLPEKITRTTNEKLTDEEYKRMCVRYKEAHKNVETAEKALEEARKAEDGILDEFEGRFFHVLLPSNNVNDTYFSIENTSENARKVNKALENDRAFHWPRIEKGTGLADGCSFFSNEKDARVGHWNHINRFLRYMKKSNKHPNRFVRVRDSDGHDCMDYPDSGDEDGNNKKK